MKLKEFAEKHGYVITEDSCPITVLNEIPGAKELDKETKVGEKLTPYCMQDDCENCWDIDI